MISRQHLVRLLSSHIFNKPSHHLSRRYFNCNGCQNRIWKLNHISRTRSIYSKRYRSTSSATVSILASSQSSTLQVTKQELETVFPLRFIFVNTCKDYWEDFPDGVQFDVGYVDSNFGKCKAETRAPVILGLPSSVGTHEELTPALNIFAKLGYRVVIPNLPDNHLCRGCSRSDSTVFEQFVIERTNFVKNFLHELQITKVDMLVANACSVYTAVKLTATNSNLVRSVALVNPTGLHYTNDMQPVRFHKTLGYIWDDRHILQPFMQPFITLGKQFTQKRHWPTRNVITYSKIVRALALSDGSTTADSDYVLDASQLVSRGVPVFTMYGEDDSNFNKESSQEYLELLGLPKSAIDVYDHEEKQYIGRGSGSAKNTGVLLQGQPADIARWNMPFVRRTLLNYFKVVRPDL